MTRYSIAVPVVNDDPMLKLFMDNLRRVTIEDVKLSFLNVGNLSDNVFSEIAEGFEFDVIRKEGGNVALHLNEWMRWMREPYGCIVLPNVLMNAGWLTELRHYHDSVEGSGVVGLKQSTAHLKLTSVMFADAEKEDMRCVYVNDTHFVENVLFFHRDVSIFVGEFHESPEAAPFIFKEWTFRHFAAGLNNFYLKYHNILTMPMDCRVLNPAPTASASKWLKDRLNSQLTVKKYESGEDNG